MVFIEGGTFEMGNALGLADERPVHSVTLNDFYIDPYLITQEQWIENMKTNNSYFIGNSAENEIQEKRPVDTVSFFDAIIYCNKRSLKEGLTPCYSINGSPDMR